MKRLISFLVCLSCVYMVFQPLRLVFDGGQTLSMFIPTILIISYDRLFVNRSIIVAAIYTIIVFFLKSIGVEYFESYFSQIVSMFFAIACMEHYIKTKDKVFVKSVLVTYFVSTVFLALISIPQFYLFPEMTRQLLFAEVEGERVASQFYWSISYSSMQGIPLLIIALVAMVKSSHNGKTKNVAIISILILLIALTLGDATTPLLLSIAVLILTFQYNPKKTFSFNMRRLVLIGGLLALIMNKYVLIAFLSSVQPIFEGTSNYGKIEDTIIQLQTGRVEEDSNWGQRQLVYNYSEQAFLSHPFGIEKDNDKIGHHSFLIDQLAVLGLVLCLPLVVLIVQRYKAVAKYMHRNKYFYIVMYGSFILMAYYKNFFLKIEAWFIVSMFLLLLEQQTKNHEYVSNIVTKNE